MFQTDQKQKHRVKVLRLCRSSSEYLPIIVEILLVRQQLSLEYFADADHQVSTYKPKAIIFDSFVCTALVKPKMLALSKDFQKSYPIKM
jgi:hypothetical protein